MQLASRVQKFVGLILGQLASVIICKPSVLQQCAHISLISSDSTAGPRVLVLQVSNVREGQGSRLNYILLEQED